MKYVCGLAAGLLLTASAHADVGVTLDAGTTGLGMHLVVPMETYLNGRFGFNTMTSNKTRRLASNDYDVREAQRTFDILFDYYPISKPLRLTAGLVINNNQVDAVAKPDVNGKYFINGNTYMPADIHSLTGDENFRKTAPYLGLGWGNALTPTQAWNFSADLGILFQDKPNIHLVSLGCTTSNAVCAQIAKDVAADKQRFATDVGEHRVAAVARVSVSYRF
ncbi:MAG: hypothetical protein V4582_14495 [Pseudomonadota bacterium]